MIRAPENPLVDDNFGQMKVPGIMISWSSVFTLVLLAVAAVFAVILYRSVILIALAVAAVYAVLL